MEQIPGIIHESWHNLLQPLFDDDRMKYIKNDLLASCNFLPESKNIFRVFSMPISEIKVVILGQDPYPTPGNAIGLAFAVSEGTKTPASLRIIRTEVVNSVPWEVVRSADWNTLLDWEKQGIFLLNTALTVQEKRAGSHLRHWQWFTEKVIKIIAEKKAPIWVLWGKKAQQFESIIMDKNFFVPNTILKAPHPAA